MTEDEKHELRMARIEEAARRWHAMSWEEQRTIYQKFDGWHIAYLIAQLTEEDWRPEPAVDPDLIEARTCARLGYEAACPGLAASSYELGEHDNSAIVQTALLAIKRAKEAK